MKEAPSARRTRRAIFPLYCTPLAIALACAMPFAQASADTRHLWTQIGQYDQTHAAPSTALKGASKQVEQVPVQYRMVMLDASRFAQSLRKAAKTPPAKTTLAASPAATATIDLPLPEGGFSRFTVTDSGVMPAALAARYPSLISLKGNDAEGRQVRIDAVGEQIQAWITDKDGSWVVQPALSMQAASALARQQPNDYIVYRREAMPASDTPFTEGEIKSVRQLAASQPQAMRASSGVLYDFRIAITATSAYTAKMGGGVINGMAGVVRTANRVNQIFENDFGIHLTLVSDNDKLIFADPASDPFAKFDDDYDVAVENARVTDRILGQRAFDIGHVLDGRQNSGVAGALGNTCIDYTANIDDPGRSKAVGMTGSARPFGDPFHVDFVAHELGHQLGARHTFNARAGQRDSISALEPGSGSTIMGYAGLFEAQDLQSNSDPYFHAANIEQVGQWVASAGGHCAAKRLHPRQTPSIDTRSLPQAKAIPARTPFQLTAATQFDPPDARLTYTWEQIDLGAEQIGPLVDTGSGPLFRSRLPTTLPTQWFPAAQVVLGKEAPGLGDAYPQTNRDLRFRLTVRDNQDQLSTSTSADVSLRVVDNGAAFAFNTPQAFDAWKMGTTQRIRWNVAGTTGQPINCSTVSVQLSTDGGYTYLPQAVATRLPNNGVANIAVPVLAQETGQARLRLSCDDNIFFAVSPGDLILRK